MSRQTQKTACPACGGSAAFQSLYVKNGCAIARCPLCGLGCAPDEEFRPEAYYTREYFNGERADGYVAYEDSEAILRREFRRDVRVLRRYLPGGTRVLEIGCAYGYFLKEAAPWFRVAGIEIAQDAVLACRRAGLVDVCEGPATAEAVASMGTFDAAVLLDVIEHLPDPFSVLAAVRQGLSPSGVVLLTTGDFGSLHARLAGRNWRLMTPPQHLWFFTTRSIAHVAHRLGLEVVEVTHPWKLVPLSLLLFQLRRISRLPVPRTLTAACHGIGLPLNLFDVCRVVLQRPSMTSS